MARYREYTPNDETPLMDGDEQFIGVNMRLEPDKVQPGFLAYGTQNMRFRKGEAETRLGLVKPGWVNVTNGTNGTSPAMIGRVGTFYGAGVFLDPDSFEWTMLAADGNIYRCRPGNARQSVPLPTGVQILSECSFCQAFGNLFCFRGRYLAPLVLNTIDQGFMDIEPLWNAGGNQSTGQPYAAAVTALSTVADEVAYGPFQSIAHIQVLDKIVIVTTTLEHGYINGADVTVQGVTASGATGVNGRWNISAITSTTFQIQYPSGAATVGGYSSNVGKVSNMSFYWKALGSQVTPTALTWATNVATVTKAGHGFSTGQYVTIAGVTPTDYNGTWQITVTSSSQFTYALPDSALADATGYGTATTSVVLDGQSPDTNPEAWQQIFNVLPNADDAVYINNRLMVPTAYTPDTTGYDSTAVSYTKKDYLVATDSLDYIHFDFINDEFRINEGDDDEIQCLVVYNMTTLLIFKTKSWGILTGIGIDLSQVALNMFGDTYGACALRSAVTAGADVLFPSSKRGICSCYMTQLGQVRGTDTPFSNEMDLMVQRINWNYAASIRMAWWNDCLYCAVPLDDAVCQVEMAWTPGPVQTHPPRAGALYAGLTPGRRYWFNAGTGPGAALQISSGTVLLKQSGWFTPEFNTATAVFQSGQSYAGQVLEQAYGNNALLVYDYRMGFSGSPLTYDFRGGQWAGPDTGPFCVQEFFKATVNGLQRLFFVGADGFVSMLEEALEGDQVYNGNAPMGLSFTPIASAAVTRGYRTQDPKTPEGQRKWNRLNVAASTWNPSLNITGNTGAAFSVETFVAGLAFDRVTYFTPFDAAAWDNSNANADFQTPGRYDYSVTLASGGTVLTGGLSLATFQELTKRVSLRPLTGRFAQFAVTSASGRMRLKAPSGEAVEGPRRNGVLI